MTNLKFTGSCIRDTDLFQKEVSKRLNSDVAPVYNLVKQFARLLPVYFNEIGAEGKLRDVSTELDELTRRQDRLIHSELAQLSTSAGDSDPAAQGVQGL